MREYKQLNEVNVIKNFSMENDEAGLIVNSLVELGQSALAREYGHTGLIDKDITMDKKSYNELNKDVKDAILSFSATAGGYKKSIDSAKDIVRLFDNQSSREVYNAIVVDALETIILGAEPRGIMEFANIEDVELGDSYTFEIEAKGLPVAQRNSYTSNVTYLDGHTKQPLTITPRVYSLGIQMDYIRLLDGSFDFGREIAKVAMAMLYAQYKLVVKILFDSANLTSTPFYFSNYDKDKIVALTQAIQTMNGGAPVVAYGTKVAFNKIGGILTQNFGFAIQDEYVKNGVIGSMFGVPNVVIDQSFDSSVPLSKDFDNMLVPDDFILFVSANSDKPVKLVREKFVRAIDKDPDDEAIYRRAYKYFMSFDAGLATQSSYGMMGTAV